MSPPPLPPAPSVELAEELKIVVTVPDSIDASGVDLDGAIAAYKRLVELGDKAGHAPQRDWEAELSKYAIDPVLSQLLKDLDVFRSAGTHTRGHANYEVTVVSVEPRNVQLRACVDNTGVDVVKEDGTSVRAGAGRFPQPTHLVWSEDGRWHVDGMSVNRDAPC